MLELKLAGCAHASAPLEGSPPPEELAADPASPIATALRLLTEWSRGSDGAAEGAEDRLNSATRRDEAVERLIARLLSMGDAGAMSSTPTTRVAAQLAQRLALQSHDDFKGLVQERSREAGRFRGRRAVVEALELSLASAWRALCVHARSYTPLPPGFWRDCHALYACIDDEGWSGRSPGGGELSLGERYRRLMLLGMSAVNRLEWEKIDLLIELVEREAHRVELRPLQSWDEDQAGFAFRVDADAPARFTDVDPRGEDGGCWWLVDVGGVVHELGKRLALLQGQDHPPPDEMQLLVRLGQEWGNPPRRRHARRRQGEDDQVELVSLLKSCWRLARSACGRPCAAAWQLPLEEGEAEDDEDGAEPVRLRVCNASASGLLLQGEAFGHPLRAGELVMVRRGALPWQAGLVRWVAFPGKGLETQCGIEIVGANPQAVLLRPVMSHNSACYRRALRLRGGRALIVAGRLYQPAREFLIADESEPAAVRATRLLLQTARYQVFEVKAVG